MRHSVVHVERTDDVSWAVTFDYHPLPVEVLKAAVEWPDRRWDPETKRWTVILAEHMNDLAKVFELLHVEFESECAPREYRDEQIAGRDPGADDEPSVDQAWFEH